MDSKKVQALPLALQRRIVRAAAEELGLQLEFHQVGQMLGLLRDGLRASLSDDWTACRRGQSIWFERDATVQCYALPLQVPGEVTVGGRSITSFPIHSGTDGSSLLLDFRFAEVGLVVRNWQEGERFRPAHRKQARKIKELLQDRHVTGREKKEWPVIAAGEQVVWLGGYGVGQDFVAKGNTGVLIREISIVPDGDSK